MAGNIVQQLRSTAVDEPIIMPGRNILQAVPSHFPHCTKSVPWILA